MRKLETISQSSLTCWRSRPFSRSEEDLLLSIFYRFYRERGWGGGVCTVAHSIKFCNFRPDKALCSDPRHGSHSRNNMFCTPALDLRQEALMLQYVSLWTLIKLQAPHLFSLLYFSLKYVNKLNHIWYFCPHMAACN